MFSNFFSSVLDYWRSQVRIVSPSVQGIVSDWARNELGLSRFSHSSSTRPRADQGKTGSNGGSEQRLKTGHEFLVQNCKVHTVDHVVCA